MRAAVMSWFLAVSAPAFAGTWQLDPSHSRVGFSVTHMMISEVQGEFAGVTGTLDYEVGKVGALALDVQVDMATVDTRSADRDAHLAKGLNVLKGEITHPAVAHALGMEWRDPFGVWARS